MGVLHDNLASSSCSVILQDIMINGLGKFQQVFSQDVRRVGFSGWPEPDFVINDYSNNCVAKSIKSVENATAAKSTAIQEVCAGRAVALSVCTGFFKATTPIDSKFCDNDVPGVVDHDRHAVTLIGHRPGPSGKRQFLIQNSWGNSCPFTQHEDSTYPAALVGLVECELSPGGLPTGRFWVEEDLLFNNTYSMSTYVP